MKIHFTLDLPDEELQKQLTKEGMSLEQFKEISVKALSQEIDPSGSLPGATVTFTIEK